MSWHVLYASAERAMVGTIIDTRRTQREALQAAQFEVRRYRAKRYTAVSARIGNERVSRARGWTIRRRVGGETVDFAYIWIEPAEPLATRHMSIDPNG